MSFTLSSSAFTLTPTVRFCTFSSRRTNNIVMSAVRSSSASTCQVLRKFREDCETPKVLLRKIADAISDDMQSGLDVEGSGDLKMLLTYVDVLPSGKEEGLFYALDLGGTNFRVLRVQLRGKTKPVLDPDSEFEEVPIPEKLKTGTREELFGFIASKLKDFVAKEDPRRFWLGQGRKVREIGFTFSFPVNQTSIDSGTLVKWTKGFDVSGMEGKNVVECLNEAMEAQELDMRVSALVNDGVAALAGARYKDPDVMASVILGTGTNACYVEQKHSIPKLKSQNLGTTIINTEWGGYSRVLPQTRFDKEMDAASSNRGEQLYEKMISGMYLGEIVRRVLLQMCKTSGLFGQFVPEKLSTPFELKSADVSKMLENKTKHLENVGEVLKVETNLEARKRVVEVCEAVVKRGGRLAGAGIVAILDKIERDTKRLSLSKRTVVAMDGGLYENNSYYREYMQDAIVELLGDEFASRVVIEHTKDVSGIGAALLAATNSSITK